VGVKVYGVVSPDFDLERKCADGLGKMGAMRAAFRYAPDSARRVILNQFGRRRET
jgi:hypothetical protein